MSDDLLEFLLAAIRGIETPEDWRLMNLLLSALPECEGKRQLESALLKHRYMDHAGVPGKA